MKKTGSKSFDVIYFMNTFSIKREFLFFDKIYYNPHTLEQSSKIGDWLSSAIRQDNGELFYYKMAEINELIQNGRLVPFIPFKANTYEECVEFQEAVEFNQILTELTKFDKARIIALKKLLAGKNTKDSMSKLFTNSIGATDLEAILMANTLTYKGEPCTPIITGGKSFKYSDNKTILINQIINSFPILTLETDWDSILSFRNNSEVKDMLLTLVNWITDIGDSQLTAEEYRNKIEFYQREYEKHISLHKARTENLKFDNLILTPVTILENLVKIKWSEVAKFFSDQRKAELALRAELLELKGREVAYISKINEVFDNPKSQLVKEALQ